MSDDFGDDIETINGKEWDWKKFKTTKDFPISPELIDWIIGQEHAIEETKLCIDEWVRKLDWLKERQWWKAFEIVQKHKEVKIFGHHLFTFNTKELIFNPKPQPKEYLPAGPFLLLLGDAGTGKSLLGRAMAGYMTEVYKKHGIKLYDVCSWRNRIMPSEPKISIHPTPEGRKVVNKAYKVEARKGLGLRILFNGIVSLMLGFGGFLMSYIFGYSGLWTWFTNQEVYSMFGQDLGPVQQYYGSFINFIVNGVVMGNLSLIMMAIMALSMGGMLFIFMKMFGFMGGKGAKGIGGAENTKAPKLLIDNSNGNAPFVDATGHGSSQLFGSIAWDPYQTGDLGTPEHQRVSAGDVHRAHLGVLYIDEIKNLDGAEAVTLLTVLEDGQLPVALRSHSGISGDTAAMAVATEPIPCMVFLIAAGNLDSLPQIHAALMDRIRGYGKVVYMNNDMENNVVNRRKYVQFMSQEIKRFNLLPFTCEACMSIIAESRRKSGRKVRLSCKFRPMISIIKTASTLAANEGCKVVDVKHVNEAICEHCKSIQLQILERNVELESLYRVINPNDEPKVGQIYGMSVSSLSEDDSEMLGGVTPIKASIVKRKKKYGIVDFTVTGVSEVEGSWIQNSIQKVRHIFIQLFKKDPALDFSSHIDFAQEMGTDGPSAGVAMTLALISAYKKKKIRQDVAVTGEINLAIEGKIFITPIGGTHEKIMAAQKRGFKKVCIPERNYINDIIPSDYMLKVVSCKTLQDYMREVFED